MKNGCFTKHPVKNCLGFQGCLFPVRLGLNFVSGSRSRMDPIFFGTWGGFFEGFQIWQTRSRKSDILSLKHQKTMMLVPHFLSTPLTVKCFFSPFRRICEHFLQNCRWPPGEDFDSQPRKKSEPMKDQVVSKKAIKAEAPFNYIPNFWPSRKAIKKPVSRPKKSFNYRISSSFVFAKKPRFLVPLKKQREWRPTWSLYFRKRRSFLVSMPSASSIVAPRELLQGESGARTWQIRGACHAKGTSLILPKSSDSANISQTLRCVHFSRRKKTFPSFRWDNIKQWLVNNHAFERRRLKLECFRSLVVQGQ